METAAVLPALVVVLAAALWVIQVVGIRLECVDAARTAARAAARGEDLDQVRAAAQAATRPNAQISITRDPEHTKIEIKIEVYPAWGPTLPAIQVSATATTDTEP
ncbi:TadE family type IV pilus minor pilin [Nonomuraea sediminis]|uniref:TadE family type IV pilus minor pilin n=1 Tax=Nonomuraea sediminis TaxID=2835864 RepID=UPI001BDD48C7|nr:TadE family type IV pilus minor pilin [Nonomuraea sediminis]